MFGCLKEGRLQARPEYLHPSLHLSYLLSHQPNPTLLTHLSVDKGDTVRLAF